jgi:hypothetical protein
MNPKTLTIVRIALLLAGIGCFAYSMNSGNDMARWVAIGCVVAALLVRVVGKLVNRP